MAADRFCSSGQSPGGPTLHLIGPGRVGREFLRSSAGAAGAAGRRQRHHRHRLRPRRPGGSLRCSRTRPRARPLAAWPRRRGAARRTRHRRDRRRPRRRCDAEQRRRRRCGGRSAAAPRCGNGAFLVTCAKNALAVVGTRLAARQPTRGRLGIDAVLGGTGHQLVASSRSCAPRRALGVGRQRHHDGDRDRGVEQGASIDEGIAEARHVACSNRTPPSTRWPRRRDQAAHRRRRGVRRDLDAAAGRRRPCGASRCGSSTPTCCARGGDKAPRRGWWRGRRGPAMGSRWRSRRCRSVRRWRRHPIGSSTPTSCRTRCGCTPGSRSATNARPAALLGDVRRALLASAAGGGAAVSATITLPRGARVVPPAEPIPAGSTAVCSTGACSPTNGTAAAAPRPSSCSAASRPAATFAHAAGPERGWWEGRSGTACAIDTTPLRRARRSTGSAAAAASTAPAPASVAVRRRRRPGARPCGACATRCASTGCSRDRRQQLRRHGRAARGGPGAPAAGAARHRARPRTGATRIGQRLARGAARHRRTRPAHGSPVRPRWPGAVTGDDDLPHGARARGALRRRRRRSWRANCAPVQALARAARRRVRARLRRRGVLVPQPFDRRAPHRAATVRVPTWLLAFDSDLLVPAADVANAFARAVPQLAGIANAVAVRSRRVPAGDRPRSPPS
jgi:hypothetical protein